MLFLINHVTCPPVVQQISDCLSSYTKLPCLHFTAKQVAAPNSYVFIAWQIRLNDKKNKKLKPF